MPTINKSGDTPIGVRLHSVVEDGILTYSDEILDINTGKKLSETLSGLASGDNMSGLAKIVYSNHISQSLNVNPRVIEKGKDTEVTLTWNTKLSGDPTYTFKEVHVNQGDAELQITDNKAITTINATTTFTLKGVYDYGITISSPATVTAVRKFYYGSNTTLDVPTDKNTANLSTNYSGNYTIKLNSTGYIFFICPPESSIASATFNGYSFPLKDDKSTVIDGVTYKVYYSPDILVADTYTININVKNG